MPDLKGPNQVGTTKSVRTLAKSIIAANTPYVLDALSMNWKADMVNLFTLYYLWNVTGVFTNCLRPIGL